MLTERWLKTARKAGAVLLAFAMICSFMFIPQAFALEPEVEAYEQEEAGIVNDEADESENETTLDEAPEGFMEDYGEANDLSAVDRSGEAGWNEGIEVTSGSFVSALGSGNVLKLTENISLSSAVTHSGNLTIFGNGYTITFGTSARINLSGSGALKVYDLNIAATSASPLTTNNGAGVFCANNGATGAWTADFYSVSFSGAALVGTNVADSAHSHTAPKNYFTDVAFHETNTLLAKDHRGLNAVVFAQNVTIEGAFTMSATGSVTGHEGAQRGYYFKSPCTSSPSSEHSSDRVAYGTFEIAEGANVAITRVANTALLLDGAYLRSMIYGYEKHIFGENAAFEAIANTNRHSSEEHSRSAIIRSEAASEFIVKGGARVALETGESVSGSGDYGYTALLLRRASQLTFTVEAGATLDVTAKGNVSGAGTRANSPVMIMGTGTGNTATTICGTMNIRSQNGNGWYYEYNHARSNNRDTFVVDGGVVNITAGGNEGNRAHVSPSGSAAPSEYAAFEHHNDNAFTLDIKNKGVMQINITGWRAISLAGTALSGGAATKTINIAGSGSKLLINPNGADGKPTGYAQFAIAAEGIITFNLNITNGGEMYARNTQDSNIYTVGTANYNVSGSGSKLTLIKTGTTSTGSNKYSLYGAIFHDTNGPLNVNVSDGGYMWVESSYGSRAAICAQSHHSHNTAQSSITVDGSGSELFVINRNTDLTHCLSLNKYIEDSALYPLGAVAFAANTSGNITVSNGANFYAESHNPISPTIALGAYHHSTPTGVFTADCPGEIDIRNDGSLANSSGTVDIRGIALRGRNNYWALHYMFHELGNGAWHQASDSSKTIDVKNGEITVYERNGGYDKGSFEDWGEEHVIRHWRNATFFSVNVGTTGGVTNTDGTPGANGMAVSSGTTAVATDFTLNDYGRIHVRGVSSDKKVALDSEAGVDGAAVKTGDLITYSVTYINFKDVIADLVITDTLPDGLEYVDSSGGATVSGNRIEWQLYNIGPGTGGEVRITARVTAEASGSVTNKAELDWTFVGGTTAKQVPSVTNPVSAFSLKYVSPESEAGIGGAPVRLDDEITYVIKYVNNTGAVSNVTITDRLPDSLSYVSSDGSFDGDDMVTWNIPNVAAGGSGTVTVTVRVSDVTGSEKIVNRAEIEWSAGPGDTENPEATNPVGASKYVADDSTAGVNGAVVKSGDEITYEIKYVNNTGEDNATVTITDELSASLAYLNGSATGDGTAVPNVTFNESGGTLTWTVENVAKDTSGTVSFTATVSANLSGISQVHNRADLKWETAGGVEMSDEAEVTNPAVNSVSSSKYVSQHSEAGKDGAIVYVGDKITYVIDYVNSNGEVAGVVIKDKIADGLKYVSSTGGGIYDPGTETVSWNIQNVSVNGHGSVTVTAVVTEDAGSIISNSASLEWSWDEASGTDTENPGVENPVGSDKYVYSGSEAGKDGSPVTVGDEITYEIRYVNNTGETADLVISDTLPVGVEYVCHMDELGAEQTNGSSPLSWTFNDVPSGTAGFVRVTVRVTEAAAAIAKIVNSAELNWSMSGGSETEEPEVSVPVGSIKYISGGDGAAGAAVQVGDKLTYTITYRNNTGGRASLTITDALPQGVSYASSTGGGIYSDGKVTWSFNNLSAGASGFVAVTVLVTEDAAAEIRNKAEVSWRRTGGDTETEEPETVNPLATSKYVSPDSEAGAEGAPVRLGDEITYVIKYVNNTGAVSNVRIEDVLPAEVEYVGSTGGGDFDGTDTVAWNITGVAAGEAGTVSITVRVVDVSGEAIRNTAEATWSGEPGNPETPEVENPVGSSKYVDPASAAGKDGAAVKQGEEIIYTIKYVNNTGVTADVTITDVLPRGLVSPTSYGDGAYDSASGTITWTVTGVSAGVSGTVSFTATVGDVSGIALIINHAGLEWKAGGTTLPEDAENTNPAINPTQSTKVVSENSAAGVEGAAVHVGDLITYDVIYVNSTGDDAELTIIDTLGVGLEFVSATHGGAETAAGSGIIEWTFANVPTNVTGTVSITARVTEDASDTVVNTALFDWGSDGEDAGDEDASVENRLGSRKSIASVNGVTVGEYETVCIGDEITYKIYYVNHTESPANVTVTDALPTGLEYVGHTGGGTYYAVTNRIVWNFSGIEPNEGGYVTVTVRVTDKIGSSVSNRANVRWSNGKEEEPEIETPVGSSKYIAEGSSGENGAPVHIGDVITYEIRYINNTGAEAALRIEDVLATGLEYVSHTNSGSVVSGSPVGQTLTWNGSSIPAGESGAVTVTVKVTDEVPAEITNTAQLTWTTGGGTETEDPEVTNPVGSTKFVSGAVGEDGAKVSVGDEITYTIWYVNRSGDTASLTITDKLEGGLQYVSHTDPDGAPGNSGDYNSSTNTVVWNIDGVAEGETGSVSITVLVTEAATSYIRNAARMLWEKDGGGQEPEDPPVVVNPINSVKYVDAESVGAEGAPVSIGDKVTYTIRYVNNHDVTAFVTITDTPCNGLRYVDSVPQATENPDGTLTWEDFRVNPGESGSVQITFIVTREALVEGGVTNIAGFAWVNVNDEELDDETSVAENPLKTSKLISLINEQDREIDAEIRVGDILTYEIVYVNHTGDTANVTITDVLAKGLKYLDSSDGGQETDGTLTWTLTGIAPDEIGTVTVKVEVTDEVEPNSSGKIVNTATVKWSTETEPETPGTEDPVTTYSVTYDANGGVGGVVLENVAAGSSHTVYTQSEAGVVQSGYTFLGWGDSPESGSVYAAGESITISGDITLYAQWSYNGGGGGPIEPSTYTVTYHANGGTGSYSDGNLEDGSTHTVLSQAATGITHPDKAFAGWNTAADGSGTSYVSGDNITISGSLTLYAQWMDTFKVSYNANGGIGSYEDTGLAANSSYRILANTSVGISREGYTFTGWNTKADGSGTDYAASERATINEDLTLYAQWKQNSSGGGGSTNPPIDIEEELPPLVTFTTDHFAYIIGYTDGYVRPGSNITRGEVTTVFFRLLSETVRYDYWGTVNNYPDVATEAWYNNSISVMTNLGVITGYPNGDFGPSDFITRAELAAIAARFAHLNGSAVVSERKFNDVSGHWAENYITYAANVGWINGYPDGSFRPDEYITRAEFIAIVNRMNERMPENSDDLLPNMATWPDNADTNSWYYLDVQEATNSHFYEYKETSVPGSNYYYERWTEFRPSPNWSVLEKPDSEPYDLVITT